METVKERKQQASLDTIAQGFENKRVHYEYESRGFGCIHPREFTVLRAYKICGMDAINLDCGPKHIFVPGDCARELAEKGYVKRDCEAPSPLLWQSWKVLAGIPVEKLTDYTVTLEQFGSYNRSVGKQSYRITEAKMTSKGLRLSGPRKYRDELYVPKEYVTELCCKGTVTTDSRFIENGFNSHYYYGVYTLTPNKGKEVTA